MFRGALDITNDAYHADTSRISKSGIKEIRQSPLHYYAKYLDPNREPRKETPALRAGKIIHCGLLEPDLFAATHIVAPNVDRRTTKGKATYEEFAAKYSGNEFVIITADEYEQAMRIQAAAFAHPAARMLLTDAYVEQTFHFTDDETGAACKVRPDGINERVGFILDPKTTDDASAAAFGRSALKYAYDIQAPFYLDGVEAASGWRAEGFAFIAIEKEPPYAIGVYYIDEADANLGRAKYKEALHVYQNALETGNWAGYSDIVTRLELPKWNKL